MKGVVCVRDLKTEPDGRHALSNDPDMILRIVPEKEL
jgi:hypothetical protein